MMPPTQSPHGVISDVIIWVLLIVVIDMGMRYESSAVLSVHLALKPTKFGLPNKLLRSLHSLLSRPALRVSMSKVATSPFATSAVGVKLPVQISELREMMLAASGPPFTWLTALSAVLSVTPMFRLLFTLWR